MNLKETNTDVIDRYADYLGERIAEIKFLDKDNLKEYLKTHLNLFFNECLDDHLLDDLDKRQNALLQENAKLQTERVQMGEDLDMAKIRLKERRSIDTAWFAKANYAFKMKGVQMQNNFQTIKKLNVLLKARNIYKANTEDRTILNVLKATIRETYGDGAFLELIKSAQEKVFEGKENLKAYFGRMAEKD